MTKYSRAELVSHPHLEHCYISILTMKGVGHSDSRSYLVSVTNMHGTDSAPVHLTVRGICPLFSHKSHCLVIIDIFFHESEHLVIKVYKKVYFQHPCP